MTYYESHRTERHSYYEANKEVFKKRYSTYREKYITKVECPICKCKVSKMNLPQHNRSLKHQKKLAERLNG